MDWFANATTLGYCTVQANKYKGLFVVVWQTDRKFAIQEMT